MKVSYDINILSSAKADAGGMVSGALATKYPVFVITYPIIFTVQK